MTDRRSDRVADLFDQAISLPKSERDAFLRAECGDDLELLEEARKLLAFDAGTVHTAQPRDERELRTIGPYRILERIGEGGFGEVYAAEQTDPVRRRVAIKILKRGMDTKAVLARFEAERQALALMDHPNIARVLDAGETELGRPYFVMELIKGESITDFCDRHRLTTAERLEFLIDICHAIQHAHMKGVIHRDVKPSNVLITVADGRPTPKVIDFGIAKAMAASLTEKTVYTAQGQVIGTPAYMSPEQAEPTGLDVDTRTDVYSLGVLLYELLTGTVPFESSTFERAGFDAMRRVIREEDPPKPSTRISALGEKADTTASRRKTDPGRLRRTVSGDLDWITMKALEKDRGRRYASPSALADDIRRHLRDEPVLARQPSAAYQARKFVRRHTGAVVVSTVIVALLAASMIVTLLQARRIAEERNRANAEAEVSRQVSDFLVGMFRVSDPSESQGDILTAREILDDGEHRIRNDLRDQPEIQARLMATMGEVYRGLGMYGKAEALLEEALQLRERAHGAAHPDVISTKVALGILAHDLGEHEAALLLFEDALATLESSPDPAMTTRVLTSMGGLLRTMGRYEEARAYLERANDLKIELVGPDHIDVASGLNNLAGVLQQIGEYEEARTMFERALQLKERHLGPRHPEIATGLANLANVLRDLGEFEEARRLYDRALGIQEASVGPDHTDVARTLLSLAALELDAGHPDVARGHYERALAIQEAAVGPDHRVVGIILNGLAIVLKDLGHPEEARPLFLRAIAILERELGTRHVEVANASNNLANVMVTLGENREAIRHYDRALRIYREALGPDHRNVAIVMNNLAELRHQAGEDDEALELYTGAERILAGVLGPTHYYIGAIRCNRARVRVAIGDFAGAERDFLSADSLLVGGLGPDDPAVAENCEEFAALLRATGRIDDAEALDARAAAIRGRSTR